MRIRAVPYFRSDWSSVLGRATTKKRQQPDEQVEPVEIHRHRDVDRVVEGARHPHGAVHVVDDHPREQSHAGPVQPGHDTADIDAKGAGKRSDHQANQQDDHPAEQPDPPALETVRNDSADESENDNEGRRDEQHLHDAGRGVQGQHRSQHETERNRHKGVSEQRHRRVVALHRHDDPDDGQNHHTREEAEGLQAGRESPVLGDLRRQHAGDNPRERETGDGESKQVLAHLTSSRTRTALPDACREAFHGIPLSDSVSFLSPKYGHEKHHIIFMDTSQQQCSLQGVFYNFTSG
jgi:hypothetical protein